ncbi:MAG: hypothetical protein CMI31_09560 [Opitutae bacterium]|nr:hypothetical protein [Opitutae bacterium]
MDSKKEFLSRIALGTAPSRLIPTPNYQQGDGHGCDKFSHPSTIASPRAWSTFLRRQWLDEVPDTE